MKNLSDLSAVDVPRLYIPWLPKEERENAGAMWHQFHHLVRFLSRFGYALALYDEAERMADLAKREKDTARAEGKDRYEAVQTFMRATQLLLAWQDIAIRDAAMTIHDFRQTMINIKQLREKCRTINTFADRPRFETCMKEFLEYFPDSDLLRNAAAHLADLTGSPGRFKVNTRTNFYSGVRVGRMVHYTINQKMLSYEISQQTLDTMREFTLIIFSTFKEVDKIGHQKMCKNPMHLGLD